MWRKEQTEKANLSEEMHLGTGAQKDKTKANEDAGGKKK
jgi:hypothetical protein